MTRIDTTKPAQAGALVNIVHYTLDVGDKSSTTAFGLVQDVRGELRQAVDTGIDAVENVVRGLFRISKRVTARVDELATDLTSAGERTVQGVIRGLRDTTRAAGELAATATAAAVGNGAAPERPVAQA